MFCGIDPGDADEWFSSRVNNNIAAIFSEAMPGVMISLSQFFFFFLSLSCTILFNNVLLV